MIVVKRQMSNFSTISWRNARTSFINRWDDNDVHFAQYS